MKSERAIYNSQTDDVSNDFRDRRVYHGGQIKRVLKMRGAMPNYDSVILLLGNVVMNKDVFKYPIYNFLESKLFIKTE